MDLEESEFKKKAENLKSVIVESGSFNGKVNKGGVTNENRENVRKKRTILI
jgi:hypothetical protein